MGASSIWFALVVLTSVTFAVGFGELVIAGILPAVARGVGVSLGTAGLLTTVYASAGATQRPWSAALTPVVIRLLSVSVFMLVGQYAVVTYIRPLLGLRGITDVATTALILCAMGAFGVAGNLVGGICVDRFGIRTTMLVSIAANIAIYVAIRFVAGPLALTIALLGLWNLASWAYSPAINGALASVGGDARDTALALNMTAFNLGIAGGSALGGFVIDTSSIANVLVLGTAMLTIAFALALPRLSRLTD